MKILVTGGRNYDDEATVYDTLNTLTQNLPDQSVTIIQGGASGADFHAIKWARSEPNVRKMRDLVTYEADWQRYGKSAGPMRNSVMLEDSQPDLVVAFPGGPGTKNMIELARKAGVRVITVGPDPTVITNT